MRLETLLLKAKVCVCPAIFPLEFIPEIKNYSIFLTPESNTSIQVGVRLVSIAIFTILSIKTVSFLVAYYQNFEYDETSINSIFPPELLKIFGFFIVFMISSATTYALIIAELKITDISSSTWQGQIPLKTQKKIKEFSIKYISEKQNKDNCTLEQPKLSKPFSICDKTGVTIGKFTLEPDGSWVYIQTEGFPKKVELNLKNSETYLLEDMLKTTKNSNTNTIEPKSLTFSDFLPYSIFITLMGTAFAFATRDLLGNYFTGIAQRVEPPFEEGDMVKVGNSSIMKVNIIGFRSVSFYEIDKNANRHIPFRVLEQEKVINYTEPTLHYRQSIYLYVSTESKILFGELKNYSVTERAEMLMLVAAFLTGGVLLPKAQIELLEENEDLEKDPLFMKRLDKFIADNTNRQENSTEANSSTTSNQPKGNKQGGDECTNLTQTPQGRVKTLVKKLGDSKKPYNQTIISSINNYKDKIEALIKSGKDNINTKQTFETVNHLIQLLDSQIKTLNNPENSTYDHSNTQLKEAIEKLNDTLVDIIHTKNPSQSLFKSFIQEFNAKNNQGNTLTPNKESILNQTGYFTLDDSFKLLKSKVELIKIQIYVRLIIIEKIKKSEKDQINEALLIVLAEQAKKISKCYYDLALILWDFKEDTKISKIQKRNIEEIAIELLNAPRVRSAHHIDEDGNPRWKMELAVTLKLAEQSDEIVHHINRRIDKYHDMFLGKKYHQPKTIPFN